MIQIDGSKHEGGGQTVRIATALSVILNKSCCISNIRANRPKPGLSNQHLAGINLVREISGAKIVGAHGEAIGIGTEHLVITPATKINTEKNRYEADAKTAGSIGLIAQIAIPIIFYCARHQTILAIKGGTDAEKAPPIKVQKRVFSSLLQNFGICLDIDHKRNGFFPVGQGLAIYNLTPVRQSNAFVLEKQKQLDIEFNIWYSVDNRNKNKEGKIKAELNEAHNVISSFGHSQVNKVTISLTEETLPGIGIGCGIYCYGVADDKIQFSLTELGQFSRHGVMRRSGHHIAQNVLSELTTMLDDSTSICLDRHHSDQVLLYAALSLGQSRFKFAYENGSIPSHVTTAIYVIELFLGPIFTIDDRTITVNGIAFMNSNI